MFLSFIRNNLNIPNNVPNVPPITIIIPGPLTNAPRSPPNSMEITINERPVIIPISDALSKV